MEGRSSALCSMRAGRRGFILASLLVAGCFEKKRTPVRYEIPEGYVGWVRIDFEQPDAAPLPLRDGFRVARIPPAGRLSTSSPLEEGWAKDQYIYYSSKGERELTSTGWGEGGMIWAGHTGTGTGERGRYHESFFVGSEADLRVVENHPTPIGPPVFAEPTPGSSRPLTE